MRKYRKKMTAAALAAVLAAGCTVLPAGAAEDEKDETVYVLAGADGSCQKIIVSDWLKNGSASQTISDKTELTDVENVEGDQGFAAGSDNTLVWEAGGEDIHYQGNIEKELPVEVRVTYRLDGEEISPQELAGKSGRVTIRIDYENRQQEEVTLGGQTETLYVPFAAVTGILLDEDTLTDIETVNAGTISDGSHTIVIGTAFPGLQEDLKIPEEEFEIPDYVEISGDTESFALGMSATLVTNEVFRTLDLEDLESEEGLKGSLEKLTGSVEQLSEGMLSLQTGAADLDTGAGDLQAASAQLSAGLDTLIQSNDSLNEGAAQVFAMLLDTANSQIAAAGLDLPELTAENYAEVLDSVVTSLEGFAPAESLQTLKDLKTSLDSYNTFYLGLQSYTAGVADAAEGAGKIKDGLDSLKDGTEKLREGVAKIPAGEELDGLKERLCALSETARNYKSFAGIDDGMDGRVRFIYRMDSIG